jgi:hypothetical protein
MESLEQPKPINIYAIRNTALEVWRVLKWKLWIALLFGLFLGGLLFYNQRNKTTTFAAINTFMLEDEIMGDMQSSGGTGIMTLLQGQGNANNKAVIVEIALSSMLLEKTLLNSTIINGKWQSLGNYYLELTGRRTKLNTDKRYINFNLDSTYRYNKRPDFDFLLRQLALTIRPNIVAKVKESGLIEHTFNFWNEEFARVFAEQHIRQISAFYIEKRMEKAAALLAFSKRKVDSLRSALAGQEYGLANLRDESFGTVMSRALVPEFTFNRNISVLSTQYTEAVAAFNMAKLEYEKRKPLITTVDDARSPLPSASGRPVFFGLVGFVLGFVLGLVGLVASYFIKEYLRNQRNLYRDNLSAP